MFLKTVKYQIIENSFGTATHTQLSVIYSIFSIVFYTKVYTRPIFNNYTPAVAVEIQKTKELIFANEIQVNAQIRELKVKDLNTIEQVNQLIDSKISANNQHLKYNIWELGLKLENKLKLGLKDCKIEYRLNTNQQKQANEQTKQDNQQIISANQQNEQITKVYTCANCAKTFDNCRKYAGHKTHCR